MIIGKVLYGVRKCAEDWQEEIITTNEADLEPARKWAEANGFDRFRVADITDEAPDFRKVLNV